MKSSSSPDISNEELFRMHLEETDPVKKKWQREDFFDRNTTFAHHIASKFRHHKVEQEELVNIAFVGMVKAFNKFDLEKGFKFTTYSSLVMQNEILMYFRKIKKQLNASSLDVDFMAAQSNDEVSLYELIPDGTNFEEDFAHSELIESIANIANECLKDIEYMVFSNSLDEHPLKQPELAEQLNISQSYVSRMYFQACKKIREHLQQQGFDLHELLDHRRSWQS